jgi:DNA-binding response OmpR family regulator
MAGDEQKALDAGCDDYATKPVDFKSLLGKIEKFIGSS